MGKYKIVLKLWIISKFRKQGKYRCTSRKLFPFGTINDISLCFGEGALNSKISTKRLSTILEKICSGKMYYAKYTFRCIKFFHGTFVCKYLVSVIPRFKGKIRVCPSPLNFNFDHRLNNCNLRNWTWSQNSVPIHKYKKIIKEGLLRLIN